MTRVRTTTSRREDPDAQAGPRDAWGEAIQGPLEGFCCIKGFSGASEQLCAEVYHNLDGVSKEEEHLFGCQGRVGPFGGFSSTVNDPPWHFCLSLCLGDG